MHISYEIKKGCLIFYLKDTIDLYIARYVQNYINKILKLNEIDNVILNFRDVDFIDSSGIGMVINIHYSFKGKRNIRCCEVNETIYRAFSLAKLHNVFSIDVSEQESIKNLKKLKYSSYFLFN